MVSTAAARAHLKNVVLHEWIDQRATKTGITYLSRCGCSVPVKAGEDFNPTRPCKTCADMATRNEVRRRWGEEYERKVMETRYAFSFTVTDAAQAERVKKFLAKEGLMEAE